MFLKTHLTENNKKNKHVQLLINSNIYEWNDTYNMPSYTKTFPFNIEPFYCAKKAGASNHGSLEF